jgi:nucleotide-binding universal stress UspA family protein
MKTIIAATDFTGSSFNACRYAAFLAAKMNCRVTLFNLFESPLIHSNMGMFGISYTAQRSQSVKHTSKLIEKLKTEFPGVTIEYFVTGGSFEEQLNKFTAKHLVEAVIVGLKTKELITKFIYGTHGVKLVGKINSPVIIVPDSYRAHKLNTVMLAIDNQENLVKTSLIPFARFVDKTRTKLNLLHVRTPSEFLQTAKLMIKLNGIKHEIETIEARDVDAGIKEYSAANKIDLVTVVSRKHSVFYNFFSESHTKKIALTSKVPVMSIHE